MSSDTRVNDEYTFSIITCIDSIENIGDILDNLKNQSIFFKDFIQLIIIDNHNKIKSSQSVFEEYYNNINIIHPKDNHTNITFADIILTLKGRYVIFIRYDDYFSDNCLEKIYHYVNFVESDKIITIPTFSIRNVIQKNQLNLDEHKIINLNNFQDNLLSNFLSFIPRQFFQKSESIEFNEDNLIFLLNDIFIKNQELILFNNIYHIRNDDLKSINEFQKYNSIRFTHNIIHSDNLFDDENIQWNENFKEFNKLIEYSLSKSNVKPYLCQYILDNLEDHLKFFQKINDESLYQKRYNQLEKLLNHISIDNLTYNKKLSQQNKAFLFSLISEQSDDITCIGLKKYLHSTKEFYFTIIITLTKPLENIQTTLESIINQNYPLKQVQIIIISNNDEYNSFKTSLEYQKQYPENILIINYTDKNEMILKKTVLSIIKGKYVNFIRTGDSFSLNLLSESQKIFEKYAKSVDIVTFQRYWIYDKLIDTDFEFLYSRDVVVDVEKSPNAPLLLLSNKFISYERLKSNFINEDFLSTDELLLLNKSLLINKKYALIKNAKYYVNNNEDNLTINVNKEFISNRLIQYEKMIKYSFKKEDKLPLFIQYAIIYDLKGIIVEDLPFDTNKEIYEFFNKLIEILSFISLKTIIRNRYINKQQRSFLIYLKNSMQYNILEKGDELQLFSKNYLIDTFNHHKLGLDIIDIKDESLYISGYFSTYFNQKATNVYINIFNLNDEVITRIPTSKVYYVQEERQNIKYLSIDWFFRSNFEVKIPFKLYGEFKIKFEIEFKSTQNQISFYPQITLKNPTNLATIGNYLIEDSKILLFKENILYIIKYSYIRFLKLESDVQKKLLTSNEKGFISASILRIIYLVFYPFMKDKEIWLFNDRPLLADDNAKHLFKYSQKQKDGIKKYYVLKKESNDWNTMKEINKNIVEFGSFKHKLLYLFAKKHISAFYNEDFINPFYIPYVHDYRSLYTGFIKNKQYFLQHGVISRDVTRSIKKYKLNLCLFLCSAELEKQSILDLNYGYDEDVVQVLGLPRYDNLSTNTSKKQILFAPTWRYQLIRSKELFLNSDFYKSLVNFLNNEKLFKLLEEYGYQLIFKPHAELLRYMDLIELSPEVKVSTNVSYQVLFADSSLLITDFSSVFFDFSYLNKPIIYYQPNDDYHYKEAYFDFETMGFGDVIKDENEIIEKIEYYLKNGCNMEDTYKKRVSNFFKYNDKNNCKRVYEWIYNN